MAERRLARLPEPIVGRLAIIGMGLIGSSIARGAREAGLAREIVGADRDAAVRARVVELGVVDSAPETAAEAARDADLVILCVPVGAVEQVTIALAPTLKRGATVSDVGSVKGSVVRQARPHLPDGVALVPAHPVAGTENSGPDAGFSTLFVNRWCILTPEDGIEDAACGLLRAFWEGLGANVAIMSPERHDLVLAVTSHLPHLIAYNIVGTASDLEKLTDQEVITYSAGGFRDFTRIAGSDPTMWRDVFIHNKDAVLEVVARFNEDLAALARAIRWGDDRLLFEFFTRAREIRRGILRSGQDAGRDDGGAIKTERETQ